MFSKNNFYNTTDSKRFHFPTFVLETKCTGDLLMQICINDWPAIVVHDCAIDIKKYRFPASYEIAVRFEPTEALVQETIERLPNGPVNILAVGGGSSIDLAKALAAYKTFGKWKRFGYGESRFTSDQLFQKVVNFIAIPTTPASGSEVSRYFLIRDNATSEKFVSRSWAICPDIAILDYTLLESLPLPSLVLSAFDAFTHCWETWFCKYESSEFTRSYGQEGMYRIISAIQELILGNLPGPKILKSLQSAGTFGGICLSNTRTGLLHTAGEALSAEVNLSHPMSLWVFFNSVVSHYGKIIASDYEKLKKILPKNFGSVDAIIEFWNSTWLHFGLDAETRKATSGKVVNINTVTDIVKRDQVLLTKEHPSPLSDLELGKLITRSLNDFEIVIK